MYKGLRKDLFKCYCKTADEAWTDLARTHIMIRNTPIHTEEGDISITMTFGLTEMDFTRDIDYSIKKADDNLYIGKNSGRNQIVY